MFEKNEMNQIDRDYFIVQQETLFHVQLKSKNTDHIWDIESRSLSLGRRSLVINHKHKETYPWHVQLGLHPHDLIEAQEMIKKHDVWQLGGRKHS